MLCRRTRQERLRIDCEFPCLHSRPPGSRSRLCPVRAREQSDNPLCPQSPWRPPFICNRYCLIYVFNIEIEMIRAFYHDKLEKDIFTLFYEPAKCSYERSEEGVTVGPTPG